MFTWVDKELATVHLGDERRDRRLKSMVSRMASRPGWSVLKAFPARAEETGAYRFLHSPEVCTADIVSAAQDAVVGRCRDQELILAIQDTTSFTFASHPAKKGLGLVTGHVPGFLMHSVLAATAEGVPLGLLHQAVWVRDPRGPRTRDLWSQRPFAEKESVRWVTSVQAVEEQLGPQTRVVCIADREGDIYEVFAQARSSTCELLIRNSNNRRLEDENARYLWERLEAEPAAGKLTVCVPRRVQERPRTVELEVRFCAPSNWRCASALSH